MALATAATLPEQFREHARHHAPLYATLLRALADDLDANGPTATICRDHRDAPRGDVVHLRLLAGIHRLVLRGAAPALAPWYADPALAPNVDDVRAAVRSLLEERSSELRRGLDLPPQTNEVGRSACLAIGLFEAVRRHHLRRVRLLEPGASAGLNLNVDRYRVVGPDWSWGDVASPVVLDTRVSGVVAEQLVVVERRGCDLAPVDGTGPDGATYLMSFVWPSDRERMRRLTAALGVLREHPVVVERAPASAWLEAQLADPVDDDVLTVVWQSITRQYWPADESAAVDRIVAEARGRAPVAHVTMEGLPPAADGPLVIAEHGPELRVDGALIARSHFHGPPVVILDDTQPSSVADHG